MPKAIFLFCTALFICQLSSAQDADESAVRDLLSSQIRAWNAGDIDRFMSGYWKSDSLMFIGKTGVTYGYDSTLAHYKRSYPDKESMGTLFF